MSRDNRKDLITRIENKRHSKVICYITSDREGQGVHMMPDVIPIIHRHLLALEPAEQARLDLLIYSRGGDSDVPWALVSMFREYSQQGTFGVLIPYRAHSAATVVALGADEIVMTKKAELGPIDTTISSGPYNPREGGSNQPLPISVEDVTGFFALLNRIGCERPEETLKAFVALCSQVHPLALGAVNRILQQTKLVAHSLLSRRAEPLREEENQEIVRKISTEVYSHNHAISRTEALKYIGLQHVLNAEDAQIAEELWQLYEEYSELFSLTEPYTPEEFLIANNLEDKTWTGLKLACVESLARFDLLQQDMTVRRLRQIPPQVTINLSGLSLPAINIPSLPAGTTPEEINALVQQTVASLIQQFLEAAVELSTKQFIQSLPQSNFERYQFNTRWKEEVSP